MCEAGYRIILGEVRYRKVHDLRSTNPMGVDLSLKRRCAKLDHPPCGGKPDYG